VRVSLDLVAGSSGSFSTSAKTPHCLIRDPSGFLLAGGGERRSPNASGLSVKAIKAL